MASFRDCPLCGSHSDKSILFIEENIDPAKLSNFSFSSRKEPEYMNYRLVRCLTCDLVYAARPPEEQELARAYHVADYDSSEEASDAAAAYIRAAGPVLDQLTRRESALEIGTGTGAFLEHLASAGFKKLIGVEPSSAAIAAAPEHRRVWLREAMFMETDFLPASFDLICCFMTMEHVRDPRAITVAATRLLRPGGAFVIVTHDYRSWINRLLGRRSPIIDIEHMQLFSAGSTRYLLESSGFADVTVQAFVNFYSLRYWFRLMPLPTGFKRAAGILLTKLRLSEKKVGFNVGNIITAGFKKS